MKQIFLIGIVVFHMVGLQSCSPEALNENSPQACCGDDIPILPPPPPPPPPGGNSD
jgi:hypothetical protein